MSDESQCPTPPPQPSPLVAMSRRSKDELDAALEIVADWVLDRAHGRLEQDIEDTVAAVIRDHAMRLRIALVGLSKRKVLNLMELSSDLDTLEEHFRKVDLSKTPLSTVVKMYNALHARESSIMEQVAEVAESGYPTKIETSRFREAEKAKLQEMGVLDLAPSQRERVRSLVSSIRDHLAKSGAKLSPDGTFVEPNS